MEELKLIASSIIDTSAEELRRLSEQIWENPELSLKEYKAHDLLTDFFEKKGFEVDRSYTGISTAFRAVFGSKKPNLCIICEYDALPEIGHACGHNLIAEAGAAAALGLKTVLESSIAPIGMVTVMGTPAEEGDGGKVTLINNGAFKSIDVAMMVHPHVASNIRPQYNGVREFEFTFTGKAAHAAAFPWEGVNALDAAVMAYNSMSVLRQQMKPLCRIHAVIIEGGIKPNIIPERSLVCCYVRAPTEYELNSLTQRVIKCFEAAATATSCQLKTEETANVFLDIQHNVVLAETFAKNFRSLGVQFGDVVDNSSSTDMGNVSYIVPSIHPCYAIGSGEVNHSKEFTQVANTPESHAKTLVAAKAMVHTCVDILTTDGLLERIRESFEQQILAASK